MTPKDDNVSNKFVVCWTKHELDFCLSLFAFNVAFLLREVALASFISMNDLVNRAYECNFLMNDLWQQKRDRFIFLEPTSISGFCVWTGRWSLKCPHVFATMIVEYRVKLKERAKRATVNQQFWFIFQA